MVCYKRQEKSEDRNIIDKIYNEMLLLCLFSFAEAKNRKHEQNEIQVSKYAFCNVYCAKVKLQV